MPKARPVLCLCGCGEMTKGYGAFLVGHFLIGKEKFGKKPPGFPSGVLLDEADRAAFGIHRWSLDGAGYVQRHHQIGYLKHTKIRLHREILGFPKHFVDHINGNRLDNRRINLRIVNDKGNAQNKGASSRNTSGHRGVSFNKRSGKWYAYAKLDGRMISLGFFDDIEEAARVAREYREKHYAAFTGR